MGLYHFSKKVARIMKELGFKANRGPFYFEVKLDG
jgi:hypothetical protein